MSAHFCPKRATLAAAISLASGGALAADGPQGNIRLALDDVISSRPDAPIQSIDDRIALAGLIQSHPHPLYIVLEEKYQALPPFTAASEDIPDQLIAEATLQDIVVDNLSDVTQALPRYMPRVSTTARYDNITGNATTPGSSTYLTTVNPTFAYNHESRSWQVAATYDYLQSRSYGDYDDSYREHNTDVNWTVRIKDRSQLELRTAYSVSQGIDNRDPIEDFDSNLRARSLRETRRLFNIAYSRGTVRERSRLNTFYANETNTVDDPVGTGYEMKAQTVGGSYTWQMRRQFALVAEARYSDYQYDFDFRDNRHVQMLAGSDLSFGRRIRASLRAGYEKKQFEEAVADDFFDEAVWNASVQWSMRRTTLLNFETGREIYEDTAINELVDTSVFNIRDWVKASWRENWTDRLLTETSLVYRDISLKGSDTSDSITGHQLLLSAAYRFTDKVLFAFDSAFTHDDDVRRKTFTFRTDYSL